MKKKQKTRSVSSVRELLTSAEIKRFKKKLAAFRSLLEGKELTAFDLLFPGADRNEAHKKGDPDIYGNTKLDNNKIQKADGSVMACPAGETVHEGNIGGGNFVWYCDKP